MTLAYVKYNQFVEDMAKGKHNLNSDVLKLALTNTAPNVSTHVVLSDITDLSTANGYTAGGITAAFSTGAQTAGTYKLVITGGTVTASGGSVGPFRYCVLYNSTQTSPVKPLIAYFDYGSNYTLTDGNSFTITPNSSTGILTVA